MGVGAHRPCGRCVVTGFDGVSFLSLRRDSCGYMHPDSESGRRVDESGRRFDEKVRQTRGGVRRPGEGVRRSDETAVVLGFDRGSCCDLAVVSRSDECDACHCCDARAWGFESRSFRADQNRGVVL